MIATVILDLSFDKPLDYAIPPELLSSISIGSFVEVPLKSTLKRGTVISIEERISPYPLKPIQRLLNETPLLAPDLMKLANWLAHYYCTPLADVLKTVLPSSVRGKAQPKEQYAVSRAKTREELIALLPEIRKRSHTQAEVLDAMLKVQKEILLTELMEKTETTRAPIDALVKKGLLLIEKIQIDRSPLKNEEYFPSKAKILSSEQQQALDKICASLVQEKYSAHLLFGVTGSGKTEIYLQAIGHALAQNKGTIMLVPEISLTSQTIERFRSRFEGEIAILHHRLSLGERHDEWKKIQRGAAKIVIGARSAIFSPVPNLGLIIVDEEHEASYKQTDSMPAYHARDVAVMRASFNNATVVLGSATPSVESFHNALSGKYTLSKLSTRPEQTNLPHIRVVDMRPEYEKKKGFTIFSEELLNGIEKRYKVGEQTILFLNRRGYHTLLLCQQCGQSVKCPECDLTLTFHKKDNDLACHLCGYTMEPPPTQCPQCKAEAPLKFKGIGTEQVEAALYAIFPEIRVLRLDADTTKHKGSHQKLYRSFRTGKADVLLGTQMVVKGLHFPEVTLVGVLNSDMSLNIPDFRAGETTFQLLTQVAGRAGRGVLRGEVLIQTSIPENNVIQHAVKQDYEAFFSEELELRKLFAYPPFAHLAKIRFSGKDLKTTQSCAENFRLGLIKHLAADYDVTPVLAAGYAKVKGEHRLHFHVKGPKISPITQAIKAVRQTSPRNIKTFIDINPTSIYF